MSSHPKTEKYNEDDSNSDSLQSGWLTTENCVQLRQKRCRTEFQQFQLTGEGTFTIPTAQAGYPCDVHDTIAHLALQALGQLPGTGTDSDMSFAKIFQGPAESFVQFLDRLQAALSTSRQWWGQSYPAAAASFHKCKWRLQKGTAHCVCDHLLVT